ncbi:MAG: SpoIIE family protein phosphatase [Blastocatellia bacterium]
MPRLIVKTSSAGGDSVVELVRQRITLGRSTRNDLCLEDPFSSRLHAEVRQREDGFWVTDLGSANGTFFNGQRLTSPVRLREGDQIRIGETEIEFTEKADTAPTRARTSILYAESLHQPSPEATIAATSRNSASQLMSVFDTSARTQIRPAMGHPVPGQRDSLAIISRLSLTLLSPVSLDETLTQVLDSIFEFLPADRGYVMLLEQPDGNKTTKPQLVCKALKTRTAADAASEIKISRSITEQVISKGDSILTSDALQDPRFQERKSIMLGGIRSVMAVPLAVESRVSGMIYVDSPYGTSRFTEQDLQLLTLLAGVAAIRIENVRLMDDHRERERLEKELSVASEIQLRLLPESPPDIPGYQLVGVSFPCYEVGGDYYDYFRKRDGRYLIALGDVSGKGTGAALLMSSLHASVRAQATTRLSGCEVVGEINQYIYDNTPQNRYVTFFYSELDARTHQLSYINAGHNAPLLVRAGGEVTRLDVGGFPVGIVPQCEYREGWAQMEPGDVLVIYSDGVTESVNEEEEEFTEARLIEVARQNHHRTAAGIRDRVDEAITRFVGKARSVDDLTLVILKRE